jgi:hypothetical protein
MSRGCVGFGCENRTKKVCLEGRKLPLTYIRTWVVGSHRAGLGLKLWRQLAAAATARLTAWRLAASPAWGERLPPLPAVPLVTITQLLAAAQRDDATGGFLSALPPHVVERLASCLELTRAAAGSPLWRRRGVDVAFMLVVVEGAVHTDAGAGAHHAAVTHERGALVGMVEFLDSHHAGKCVWRSDAYAGADGMPDPNPNPNPVKTCRI